MNISVIVTLLKRLVAICLVSVIGWHVTHFNAPRRGQAIIHVVDPDDVVVLVGQSAYRVKSAADAPVVCDLEPGAHLAQLWQHGSLRGMARFNISPGKEVVISRFESPHGGPSMASNRPSPATEGVGSDGLAARIQQRDRPTISN